MKSSLWVIAVLCFGSCMAIAQPTYYVSGSGNDNNAGTSVSAPFRSISKVNALNLTPGSTVLFQRGDTFRGMLVIGQSGATNSPISVGAYGQGVKPAIAGSVPVMNWTSIGNGKWQATCTECGPTVTGLYANGVSQPLGRYPNSNETNRGYLTVQDHVGKNTLVSQQPLGFNWVGGEAVVRSNYFIIDRAAITQQTSNTLTLSNTSIYDLSNGYGFFIQNHPSTLDQQGEWYYNKNTKQITIYSNHLDPNSVSLTVTVYSQGITARAQTNISVSDLRVSETLNCSVYMENVSDVTIRNCEVINSGENGIWFSGSGNRITVENNLISKTNNNAFQLDTYNTFAFRSNVIRNTAVEPGRGNSGDAQYNGFIAYSLTSTIIENNIVDSTGYCAINFPKNNAVVKHNVVSNFCLTKNDGGGLYVVNNSNETMGNISLEENIIYGGFGVPEGTPDGFLGINGIYLDECMNGITVIRNTVYGCTGAGIYLHGTSNSTVDGNTCFDNKYTQYAMDYTNICTSMNNVTQNNNFVAKLPIQYAAIYNSYTTNLSTFGTFNANYYVRPLDDVQTLRLSYLPPNGRLFDPQSLVEWQQRYSKDLNSHQSPVTYKDYLLNAFTGPERVVGGDFTTGSGYGIGGPFIFSDFSNGQGTWDNNNRINGGSLNLNFTSITNNPGASLYAAQVINSVAKDKDYIIQFDAVSTVPNRLVQVYMQPQFAPYTQLVETRPAVVVGTSVQHYELRIRPVRDLANALAVLRVFESNQPLFIDNFSVREASVTRIDPDKLMQLVVNPTSRDSTILLNGNYINDTGQGFSNAITLGPFSSSVLYWQNQPITSLVDLACSIQAGRTTLRTGDVDTFTITVRNQGGVNANNVAANGQWKARLPAQLQLVSNPSGTTVVNGVIVGAFQNLAYLSSASFTFTARPTVSGAYRVAVELTASNYIDPDSKPNSGTRDGEDDTGAITIRTTELGSMLFASPDPIAFPQRVPASTDTSTADPGKADLSLSINLNKRTLKVGDLVSYRVVVKNSGGAAAALLQVQTVLPAGLQFVSSTTWTNNNGTLTATIDRVAIGEYFIAEFIAQAKQSGIWTSKAQIVSQGISDTDSSPNNGYSRGEDDEAQIDFLIR